jgi:hypothetical protein
VAEHALVERKLEVSRQLVGELTAEQAPVLAAYWELVPEKDRWVFYLVPKSIGAQHDLIMTTSKIMIGRPYRSVFSLADVFVDAHQIARAEAIGAYIRSSDDLGRQFDTTFTGGQYFESVIPIYVAPKLLKAPSAA